MNMPITRQILQICLYACYIFLACSDIIVSHDARAQKRPSDNTSKTIPIATEGAYPPFSYFSFKGDLKGFDVDLGNAICGLLRYTCTWQVYDTKNLIEAVSSGQVQVAMLSKSLSPTLTKNLALSNAYYKPNYVLVYHRDNSPSGVSTTDLLNTTLGALRSTSEYDFIQQYYSGSRVKALPQLETAFYALSRKEIDYLVIDYNVVEPWLAAAGDGRCCVYRSFDQAMPSTEQAKILMNKEATTVQAAFGTALKQLQDSGELKRLATKHGLDPARFITNTPALPPSP